MAEKLLQKDPIEAFETIKKDYVRYFETLYKFRDDNLNKKKNAELLKNDNLLKELYCELTPKYESSHMNIKAVCQNWNCPRQLPQGFDDLITKGLMDYPLYKHQYEMLLKGFGNRKNVLITSGTGSGKTESFILPLFASLYEEALTWGAPTIPYNSQWWRNGYPATGKYMHNQRVGENRPAAIRSLILYPMNALVADQVGRLRKALDSDEVRSVFDRNCKGNRIFFGSYNGRTIKEDSILEDNKKSLKILQDIYEQGAGLRATVAAGQCSADDMYVCPRLSEDSFTSEMIVREDMCECPPDILITNVSMLSIMMMRIEENDMLDKTKKYYEENSDAVFHIVVDELHLHRGTAGAEVAYLLRMFLNRIGVPPMKNGKPNPQLRIYASSASIANNSQKFLEDFFGVYNNTHTCFEIQKGYELPLNVNSQLPPLNYNHFEMFVHNAINKLYYDQDAAEKNATEHDFLNRIGYNRTYSDFINDYSPIIFRDLIKLKDPIPGTNEWYTSFPFSNMHSLPGNPSDDAIRGFLIFRGSIQSDFLPSIRFHQMYKYIEGIWGELLPDKLNGPIGDVYFKPKEVSNNGQHKVLELLRCECCGELYIGGTKKELGNGRIGMSLNDPNLDKIPNMQATPMVQNKTINDYVVFWPSKVPSVDGFLPDQVNSNSRRHFGVANINDHISSDNGNNHCRGAWKEGYLNPFDGTIENCVVRGKEGDYIHGYYYFPSSDRGIFVNSYRNALLKALPTECAYCEKDYLYRKYTKSPIRSFRTGMGRNNQLLSKELLSQIEPDSGHAAKLIGFSDSRQDAAEQAMLIAREHYRDMVRKGFVEVLQEKSASTNLQNAKVLTNNFLNANTFSNSTIIQNINLFPISITEKQALINIINSNQSNTQKISAITNYNPSVNIFDLYEMISRTPADIDGDLVKKLLELGINPAGTNRNDSYPFDSNDYWDKFYDFNNNKMNHVDTGRTINGVTYFRIVTEKLQGHIFDNCFGQYMHVNTEEAGLGYVMPGDITNMPGVAKLINLLNDHMINNGLNIEDLLSAFIRVYGDDHRYTGDYNTSPMRGYDNFKPAIKKIVSKLSAQSGIADTTLGNAIDRAMREVACDDDGLLQIQLNRPNRTTSLRFKLADRNAEFYICRKCGRIHLHRGLGFCTNSACREELTTSPNSNSTTYSTKIVSDLWKSNYIAYDIMVRQQDMKRLHTEELTGQTDNQSSRLLQFKNVILQGESKAREIDMLNVTTTMEVGVDIGSLQAIYQGNMSPTRYNYQQRVGRAGRRGQAYSAAVTFCRGRSHDVYYYRTATQEMTGGKPADPTLSVSPQINGQFNPVIVKRIILKHILMLISSTKADWIVPGGTCGQLGGNNVPAGDWNTNVCVDITKWLKNKRNVVNDVVHYYLDQYKIGNNDCNNLVDWICNGAAIKEMSNAVNQGISGDNALSITEAGLLPMYGMPSAVRNLYHHCSVSYDQYPIPKYDGIINRPIDMAISEFAPGSKKTKDSAEYICAGLTVPMEQTPGCRDVNDLAANANKLNPLEFSYNMQTRNDNSVSCISKYDPNLVDQLNTFRLVIPKAFRTEKLYKNNGTINENEDSRSNFTMLSTWVDIPNGGFQSVNNGAGLWSVWNGNNQKRDVWYINNNNGNYFIGKRDWIDLCDNDLCYNRRYTLEPYYFTPVINNINNKLHNSLCDHAPSFMITRYYDYQKWKNQNGVEEKIAIGYKKVTDILCLALDKDHIPVCLNLNVNNGGNRSAIISAFYSAATLIQRTYADMIDIDPEEIEISEVKIDTNTGMPSVYINDKAANGAGYISTLATINPLTNNYRLVDIMMDIVSSSPKSKFIQSIYNHKQHCPTSCPECLNTFYNRGLHHILDWRLGIDIIKLMLDSNYKMGYDDLRNTPYGDLDNIFNQLGQRVMNSNPMGNVKYHPNNGQDWRTGYLETAMNGVSCKEHIVHPLWNVIDQENIDGYAAQNIFKLHRNVKESPIAVQPANNQSQEQQKQPIDAQKSSHNYGPLG